MKNIKRTITWLYADFYDKLRNRIFSDTFFAEVSIDVPDEMVEEVKKKVQEDIVVFFGERRKEFEASVAEFEKDKDKYFLDRMAQLFGGDNK